VSHEVEQAAFALEPAWHGLGIVIDRQITSAEALDLVPVLASEIVKVPVTYNGFEVQDKFFTVRVADDKPLGIVGNRYTVLQNREALDLMDSMVLGGEASYESVISLRGGSRVALVIKLKGLGVKVGGVDQVDGYLLLTNTHDGSSQIVSALTPIRVVCKNTLDWALGSAKLVHKVRHTKNMKDKIAEAKAVFDMTQTYMSEFERDATILMYEPMSDGQWEEFLGKLIVIPEKKSADKDGRSRTIALNKHADITSVWDDLAQTAAAEFSGTRWGALQAVSHYNQRLASTSARGTKPKGMTDATWNRYQARRRAENLFDRTLPDSQGNLTAEAHKILTTA